VSDTGTVTFFRPVASGLETWQLLPPATLAASSRFGCSIAVSAPYVAIGTNKDKVSTQSRIVR
jgi:hypothetical protein